MFKDTPDGQTHYCIACEVESRGAKSLSDHTCGYYEQPFEQPKDYFWLIIGILTPLAIGAVIFFFWYLNLILNLP